MMGEDCADHSIDGPNAVLAKRESIIHAAMIRAAFVAARGLTPSQACNVGCATCGVIDASPSRCEQCTGVHQQNHFRDATKKVCMTDAGFLVDGEGSEL